MNNPLSHRMIRMCLLTAFGLLLLPMVGWGQTSITCGQTITNRISAPSEIDQYIYSGTVGQALAFAFSGDCPNGQGAQADVYNPSGQIIAGLSTCAKPSTNLVLAASGTYTILVHAIDYTYTPRYALGIQLFTAGGCNGTAITCGQTLTNRVHLPSELDAYSYVGSVGQPLAFGFSGDCPNGQGAQADVYNPSGQIIAGLNTCAKPSTNLVLAANGTYTILVHAIDYAYTPNYALGIQSFTGGGCSSTAITCGQTLTNRVHLPSEMDAYSYAGSAGQTLAFGFSGDCPNGEGAQADVYNPSGQIFARLSTCGTLSLSTNVVLSASGTYTILVHSIDYAHTPNYALGIQSFTGGGCGGGGWVLCGQTVSNQISGRSEIDSYSIAGNAGELDILSVAGFGGSRFDLYNPAGNLIVSIGPSTATNLTFATTGVHTLLVHGNSYTETGNYSITFTCLIGHPNVTASSPLSTASEFGPVAGSFRFARAGVTNGPLTVLYTVSGSASNGLDYVALSGSATIPAGAFSVDIIVTPIPDNLIEGDETVTVGALSNPFYYVGSPSSASLTIKDEPFDEWRFTNFTAAERTNPTIVCETCDPDEDGIPNLLEYALNLNPKQNSVAGLPTVAVQGGYLTLTYTEIKAATDIVYAVQAAGEVNGAWSSSGLVETARVDHGTYWTVTVRDSVPLSAASHRFMRLEVTR